MTSVFVVNVERADRTETLGIYLTEKLAKAASSNYVESDSSNVFKKKQVKKELLEVRKVLFVSLPDTTITMSKVPFEFPQGKNRKAKKDPLAPKKGLSPFMIYNKENRERIQTANPEASFGDIGKLIGNAWKSLTDKQKDSYTNKSELDKQRHTREHAVYMSSKVDETTVETTVEATEAPDVVVSPVAVTQKKRAVKKAE